MVSRPLLLEACIEGAFGSIHNIESAVIYEAGFIYLEGEPFAHAIDYLEQKWKYRMFIPLSKSWEGFLRDSKLDSLKRTIYEIKDSDIDTTRFVEFCALPAGYRLSRFDSEAFERHPFCHGSNYPSYEDFERRGSGSVIWYDNEIVASASSYLSYDNSVELDISTLPEHRRKGLAKVACSAMILDCHKRGIEVHWDAQNDASRCLASELGFCSVEDYTAYGFIIPENP